MGFDINELFDGFLNRIYKYSFISNPIALAIVISAILIVINYVIYRNEEIEGGFKLAVKMGIYSAFVMIMFLFLHNKVIHKQLEDVSFIDENFGTDIQSYDDAGNVIIAPSEPLGPGTGPGSGLGPGPTMVSAPGTGPGEPQSILKNFVN